MLTQTIHDPMRMMLTRVTRFALTCNDSNVSMQSQTEHLAHVVLVMQSDHISRQVIVTSWLLPPSFLEAARFVRAQLAQNLLDQHHNTQC